MSVLDRDKQLVRELLDEWYRSRSPCLLPGAPEEMIAVGLESSASDWVSWKMLPSTVTQTDLYELELSLPAALPSFFKAFLSTYFVLDLDFGDYGLVELPSDQPLAEIRELLTDDLTHEAGFMVFGDARGSGDPLCFDFMSPTEECDYPIFVFNHDVVPQSAWPVRADLLQYAGSVAKSFRDFLPRLLQHDPTLFPPPLSPEEIRRNKAWTVVTTLLMERGLQPYFRPEGVNDTDPWAIAEHLRNLGPCHTGSPKEPEA